MTKSSRQSASFATPDCVPQRDSLSTEAESLEGGAASEIVLAPDGRVLVLHATPALVALMKRLGWCQRDGEMPCIAVEPTGDGATDETTA